MREEGGREGGRDKPWFSVEEGAMDLRKGKMRSKGGRGGREGEREGGREGGRDKPWFSVEDGAMDLRKREMRYWIALSKV